MPRMIVDLSDEMLCQLEDVARRRGISRDQATQRAFALLFVADEQKTKGNSLVVVRDLPQNRIRPVARLVEIF
jgi:hypothetical protein